MKFEPRKLLSQLVAPDVRAGARPPLLDAVGLGYEGDTLNVSPAAKPAEKPEKWSKKNPMPMVPRGQAMMLSANLREGLVVDPGDVEHTKDMKNFVDRVAKLVPYAPDVLTLNEVVGPSAENVARLLSARTGRNYKVVIAPGASPYSPGPITKDTAVLVNADRYKVEKRGFISTTTPKGTNMPTYARLKQKGSELRLNVASVHFPATSAWDLGREETDAWRMKIGKQVNAHLQRTDKGPRTINVMAGDFNAKKKAPIIETITEKWGYKDSLREKAPEQDSKDQIDYIFAQGKVLDAGKDVTYTREMIDSGFRNGGAKDPATGDKRERNRPKQYYSDHAFEWAIVGKPKK